MRLRSCCTVARGKRITLALLFAMILCFSGARPAAADACTVTGAVLDRTNGKGLGGAEVFLTHVERNIPSRAITNDRGEYLFSLVFPPGIYRITVRLAGYRTVEYGPLSVRINDVTIPVPPISLDPSTGTAGVLAVDGRSAAVNSSDATHKLVFEPEPIQMLPLGGVRSFDQLALLAPGVTDVPASSGTGPGVGSGVGTAGQFSVNGQRGRNNSFMVDLSDNNDQDVGVRRQGYVSLVPQSVESIQNYQVLTGNYQAEFGRNSGSIVNAISRSGTNRVHGIFYGYFADDMLSARNFFDQIDGPVPGKSPFQRQQYGLVLGGPLVREKAFWFGSFERQRVNDRPERHFAVPTLKERSFLGHSPLTYSEGNGHDSMGRPLDDLSEYFQSQGVAMFGVAGRGIWGLVPEPNNPAGPYGLNTYTQRLSGDGDGAIGSVKVDDSFGGGNTVTARYNFTDDTLTIPVTGGAIRSSVHAAVRTQNLTLFMNSAASGVLANQARFSYGRTRLDFQEATSGPLLFGSQDQRDVLELVSPGPVLQQQLSTPISTDFGAGTYGPFGSTGALGQILISPFSPIGVDVFSFPQKRVNNTFQFADTIIRHGGSHTVRAGFDVRRTQQNSRLDRNLRPIAEFGGALDTNLAGGTVRGTDLASIGYATGFLQTLIPDFTGDGAPDFDTTVGLRFTEFAFFVMDDWKVTPRISIDFGVRYELGTVPREVNSKIESTFEDPAAGVPASTAPPSLAEHEPTFDSTIEALTAVLDGRASMFSTGRKNWAPRVGIAWDPTGSGRTAIRAGYGLFYDQNISAVTSQSRNVFPHIIPLNSGGFGVPLQGILFANPQYLTLKDLQTEWPIVRVGSVQTMGTPPGYFRGTIGLLNDVYHQGVAFTLAARYLPIPNAQHFHLTVEREIVPHFLISAAYFGSTGARLTRFRAPNAGLLGKPEFGLEASIDFPTFVDIVGKTESPHRSDPRLGAYTIFENSARSRYHSLQLFAQGRLARERLQFTAAYTWAHALDDVSDVFDGLGYYARPQSERNLHAEWASANFDVRHRAAVSWIWELPLESRHRALRDWTLAAIFVGRTAQPFTVNTSFDVNGDASLTDRLGTMQGIQQFEHGPRQLALPADALAGGVASGYLATPGQDGVVGRNTFRARGTACLDVSLLKKFRLSEKLTAEVRLEAFNAFNRTHFGVPVRILEAPAFGSAVDTAVQARQVQLAAKLSF